MSCCAPTIIPFHEALTSVHYAPDMVASYGSKPNVQVYYRDGTQYVLSHDMNNVKYDGVHIDIDHGGVNVGFVKIF